MSVSSYAAVVFSLVAGSTYVFNGFALSSSINLRAHFQDCSEIVNSIASHKYAAAATFQKVELKKATKQRKLYLNLLFLYSKGYYHPSRQQGTLCPY